MAPTPTPTPTPQEQPQSDSPESQESSAKVSLAVRGDLPTIWFDHMRIGLPDDSTKVAILSFFHSIPNTSQKFETARLMTSQEHVCQIIDVLCRVMKHYPTAPESSPEDSEA